MLRPTPVVVLVSAYGRSCAKLELKWLGQDIRMTMPALELLFLACGAIWRDTAACCEELDWFARTLILVKERRIDHYQESAGYLITIKNVIHALRIRETIAQPLRCRKMLDRDEDEDEGEDDSPTFDEDEDGSPAFDEEKDKDKDEQDEDEDKDDAVGGVVVEGLGWFQCVEQVFDDGFSDAARWLFYECHDSRRDSECQKSLDTPLVARAFAQNHNEELLAAASCDSEWCDHNAYASIGGTSADVLFFREVRKHLPNIRHTHGRLHALRHPPYSGIEERISFGVHTKAAELVSRPCQCPRALTQQRLEKKFVAWRDACAAGKARQWLTDVGFTIREPVPYQATL